jgi:hypothetical protein
MLAFRAVAIAAGMIAVSNFTARGAGIDLPASGFGPAALNGHHRPAMRGQQPSCVFLAVGSSVLAKDIRQF